MGRCHGGAASSAGRVGGGGGGGTRRICPLPWVNFMFYSYRISGDICYFHFGSIKRKPCQIRRLCRGRVQTAVIHSDKPLLLGSSPFHMVPATRGHVLSVHRTLAAQLCQRCDCPVLFYGAQDLLSSQYSL